MEEPHPGKNEPNTTAPQALTSTLAAEGEEHNSLRASHEEVWYLKDITFNGRSHKIITQNMNGCVSFLLCRISSDSAIFKDHAHSSQYV